MNVSEPADSPVPGTCSSPCRRVYCPPGSPGSCACRCSESHEKLKGGNMRWRVRWELWGNLVFSQLYQQIIEQTLIKRCYKYLNIKSGRRQFVRPYSRRSDHWSFISAAWIYWRQLTKTMTGFHSCRAISNWCIRTFQVNKMESLSCVCTDGGGSSRIWSSVCRTACGTSAGSARAARSERSVRRCSGCILGAARRAAAAPSAPCTWNTHTEN